MDQIFALIFMTFHVASTVSEGKNINHASSCYFFVAKKFLHTKLVRVDDKINYVMQNLENIQRLPWFPTIQ